MFAIFDIIKKGTVLPLESLKDKIESFNLHAVEINGHDFRDIVRAVGMAKSSLDKPTVIIAHTIPGKGIPSIEGDYRWHGKTPYEDLAKKALHDLRTMRGKIIHGDM